MDISHIYKHPAKKKDLNGKGNSCRLHAHYIQKHKWMNRVKQYDTHFPGGKKTPHLGQQLNPLKLIVIQGAPECLASTA